MKGSSKLTILENKMFYIIAISLLLFAIGIFFVDLTWSVVVFSSLLAINIILKPALFKDLMKSIAALILLILPITLIKLFTIRQGREIEIWFFSIYSYGVTNALHSAIRVFDLFLVSFLMLKVLFPIEKFKNKYSHIFIFDIIFRSIEMFPVLLRKFSRFLKRKKISKKDRKGFITTVDEIYKEFLQKDNKPNS